MCTVLLHHSYPLPVVFLGLGHKIVVLKGCHKPHLMFLAALEMVKHAKRPASVELSHGSPQPGAMGALPWGALDSWSTQAG